MANHYLAVDSGPEKLQENFNYKTIQNMYSFKSRSWSQNASGYTYINRIEHMVCSFDMFVTKGTADVLNNYQL